jgi:hypothetical protein
VVGLVRHDSGCVAILRHITDGPSESSRRSGELGRLEVGVGHRPTLGRSRLGGGCRPGFMACRYGDHVCFTLNVPLHPLHCIGIGDRDGQAAAMAMIMGRMTTATDAEAEDEPESDHAAGHRTEHDGPRGLPGRNDELLPGLAWRLGWRLVWNGI